MQSYRTMPSKRTTYSIFAILLFMMVIGSIWDYPISQAVYNEANPFGIFFAAYGEYPALLGLVAAGTMLVCARSRTNKAVAVLQTIAGGFLAISSTAMTALMPGMYIALPKPVVAVVGVVCSALTIFFITRLCQKADSRTVLRVAVMFVCVIFAAMLLVNIVKIPWGRARMRLVANDARAYFMPWWQAGGDLKTNLVAAGVAGEEFKSFPSGHTANAAMLMLLGLLPLLKPKLETKKNLLFAIGFVWAGLVAFSRIIMGAHYLTDTTIGLAIGFTALLVACRVEEKIRTKNQA